MSEFSLSCGSFHVVFDFSEGKAVMAGIRSGRKTATVTSMDMASTSSLEKTMSGLSAESLVRYDSEMGVQEPVVANMETIALKALHIDDDPSQNPWTLRMFLLGMQTFP